MLDIKKIRQEPDLIKELLSYRNLEFINIIDQILEVDSKWREKLSEKEKLEAERNKLSKKVGQKKAKKENADKELESLNIIKDKLKEISELEPKFSEEQKKLLFELPNTPSKCTPEGKSEEENKLVYEWGEKRNFDFPVLEHHEIGVQQNILDFERGVKLAKSRFTAVKGLASKLERALMNLMLDLAAEGDYEETSVPVIANADSLQGTGQFPKFKEDVFKLQDEDLYLIPTAEVPLTNLYRDEILNEEELPIRLTAYTPCFRSEAGSAGRDTRGIIRQHQFYKVELVTLCKAEQAEEEHEKLTKQAEKVLQILELPYRKVQLCSGDLGFSATKCYDLEVWFPSQNRYREISSCSLFGDFQASRAQIRFKRSNQDNPKKSKNELVHTINGSALAVGRTLAAILENYQKEDGSIEIPKALQVYMNKKERVS